VFWRIFGIAVLRREWQILWFSGGFGSCAEFHPKLPFLVPRQESRGSPALRLRLFVRQYTLGFVLLSDFQEPTRTLLRETERWRRTGRLVLLLQANIQRQPYFVFQLSLAALAMIMLT
jgi:hypothetical protein